MFASDATFKIISDRDVDVIPESYFLRAFICITLSACSHFKQFRYYFYRQ